MASFGNEVAEHPGASDAAVLLPLLVEIAGLPVLVSQFLIVGITSLMSWFGHKHFSFRRPRAGQSSDATATPHDPR